MMRVEVLPGFHVPTGLRKKPFFPGEQFDLDDKEGYRLIGLNAVKEVEASEGGSQTEQLNVAETVKLVMAAATIEDLEKLKEGEARKGVLAAIEKRRAGLEQPAE